MLEFNGGYFDDPDVIPGDDDCPPAILNCMNGIGASHPSAELGSDRSMALFDDNVPPKIVPIGNTPMGHLIILGMQGEDRGTIYLKMAYGDFYHLADGIEDFFDLLRAPAPRPDS